MDEVTLAQMVSEIAEVLCTHLPQGQACTLHAENTQMKSKACSQIFAFLASGGGIFSVNAELHHPPPVPSQLNLRCIKQHQM